MLWTVNFELSCMTSSLLDIHFLYTRVHVGFCCELGLLSNFDDNSCSNCHNFMAALFKCQSAV